MYYQKRMIAGFFLLLFILGATDLLFAQLERRTFPDDKTLSKVSTSTNYGTVYLDDAGMDSFITDIMDRYHIAGGAYCVLKDGEIVWKRNKGYANIAENRLVTDSTSFNTGSVSKTFTATALMQLWEEGLFKLDDDINDYLPEDLQVHHYYYPDDSITFKMLLTHTSGIKDDWSLLLSESMVFKGDSPISIREFLKNYLVPGGDYYNSEHFYRYSKPGEDFNYTDVGFTLIAYLVEVISEMPFNQYCQENIFEPLEMNHTAWFLSDLNIDNIAVPYKWDGHDYYAYEFMGSPYYPAAFFRISASELAAFLKQYMQKEETLLDSTTMNMILKDYLGLGVHKEREFLLRDWGLCWYEQYWGNHWLWGHMGKWYGARAAMFYDKESNYGFIDLINTGWNDISFDGWHIIGNNLTQFASLWGHIYAFDLVPDHFFIEENADSLWITTQFVNREQHTFNAQLIYTSTDSTITDSIPLFDDGAHRDHQASDGIYGCKVGPVTEENEFIITVSTQDQQNGDYYKPKEMGRFTSIGPLVLADTTHVDGAYKDHNRAQYLTILLQNLGQVRTATNLEVQLSTEDERVSEVAKPVPVPDIAPGELKSSSTTAFIYAEGYGPDSTVNNPIQFTCLILSNGYPFWTESFDYVTPIEEAGKQPLPLSFRLEQNYPNPFNPSTIIEYQIPKTCQVDLTLYNTLGQKVATLVSKKQTTGNYEIEWNASNYASGVYYYRLETDQGFVQTKKLIVLK